MNIFLFTLFLGFSSFINAQEDSLTSTPDSAFIYHRVLLYFGSSTEIDGNYYYVMEELLEFLNKNQSYKIHIRGHVCCGPAMRVSKKRAKNVYKYLKRNGVSEERMSFKGYSDTIPAVWPEKTEEDAAMNRRVDFVICP